MNSRFTLTASFVAILLMTGSHQVLAQASSDLSAPASSAVEAAATQGDEISRGAFKFVQSTAETGLKFLSNPSSTEAQKKQEFRKLLDRSFDLETIGRFALGRYWNTATPAQQKEYLTQLS